MRCRRAIRTLLVFVLLGAGATVLSSWAIHAVQFSIRHGQPAWQSQDDSQWEPRDYDRFWAERRRGPDAILRLEPVGRLMQLRQVLPSFGWLARRQTAVVSQGPYSDERFSYETLEDFRAGWPAHSLAHSTHGVQHSSHGPATLGSPKASYYDGLALWTDPASSGHNLDRFALPLLPLWPGFLMNTLFYALLLFVAWRTPIFVRRTLRRRRGRCIRCGYDRRGLDPHAACPECGASIGVRGIAKPTRAI